MAPQAGGQSRDDRRQSGAQSRAEAQPRASRTDQPRVRPADAGARPRIEATSRPAPRSGRSAPRRELDAELARRREQRRAKRQRGPLGFKYSHRRVISLGITIALVMGILIVRLAHVQLIEGPALAQAARELRTTTQQLVAERGAITDRHGNAIAESVARYRIYGDQKLLADWKRTVEEGDEEVVKGGPEYAAELLADVLEMSREELADKLTKKPDQERFNQYVVIEKDAAPETWDAVRALRISGIYSENLNKRIYPSGDTAKNIIGVAAEQGLSGLEYRLDETLSGEPGYRTYERSAHGYMLPSSDLVEKPATQGLTVRSTLDMDIQWHAEKALDDQLEKMGSKAGSVIVQDIRTCEILALADRSTTADGNTATTGRIGAVQDIFEPGSTAKVVTVAAALETEVATPLTKYKVPYTYTTSNGQTFRDSHEHPLQKLTLTGILAESSNTGTVQVGESIPKQVRYDYMYKFGFGQHTGIELAGETRGILHDPDNWDGRTQYGVLFGQGMASNALQATNVFSTVANGGRACQPHLVAGTTDSEGVYTESPKSETTQIIKEDVAEQVLSMMESVVIEGSGVAGKIDGYRVAGKTGTAQAPGPDGKLTSFVSSFIGVAPVDDPRLAVSVIIRDPQPSIWGGVVAAPVFSDVMAYSLQQLRVEPSTAEPDLFSSTW